MFDNTLKKEYRVPAFLSFKVYERHSTLEFVCSVCGIAIRDLRRTKLVFNRETGAARIVCSVSGCSSTTRQEYPQSDEVVHLMRRLVRRTESV